MFLRLTSWNCSIIFTSLVGTWTSSGDTMTATWRYSLLGPFLATQSRRPWKQTPFSGIVPLLKYGLPLWLSPSLSAFTSIFLNFLWGGASLALRKFCSVTNSLYFPLKLFPRCSDITYLVTHLGLRNEPPENGWMGIRWPLPPRGGTEQGPAVSRRICMVPSKRLPNQILKGLLQLSILKMKVADFKC